MECYHTSTRTCTSPVADSEPEREERRQIRKASKLKGRQLNQGRDKTSEDVVRNTTMLVNPSSDLPSLSGDLADGENNHVYSPLCTYAPTDRTFGSAKHPHLSCCHPDRALYPIVHRIALRLSGVSSVIQPQHSGGRACSTKDSRPLALRLFRRDASDQTTLDAGPLCVQ